MEELHNTAIAYYSTAPEHVQRVAKDFFNAMDDDRNGHVSFHEFLAFNRQGSYQQLNYRVFEELDRDGSWTLEFEEVMTLFYIIKSGRPLCGGCDRLIKAMYFTCVHCFERCTTTFSVCPHCFHNRTYTHEHEHNQFLDNFVLLEIKRNAKQGGASTSETSHAFTTAQSNSTYTSFAIIPYTPPPQPENGRKWRAARLFENAIGLGNIAAAFSGCTIM